MYFDLWTFFVEQLFGGFWLAVLGIAIIIFIILAVLGRVGRLSSMLLVMFYFLCMVIGYGYRWLTVLIGFAFTVWCYIEIKNYFSG